jgi:very-short-patch-repair endonuclease
LNLIIEVDGSYWHSLEKVKKKDKAENAYLQKCGYKVIRIPEEKVSDFSAASLFSELIAVNFVANEKEVSSLERQ